MLKDGLSGFINSFVQIALSLIWIIIIKNNLDIESLNSYFRIIFLLGFSKSFIAPITTTFIRHTLVIKETKSNGFELISTYQFVLLIYSCILFLPLIISLFFRFQSGYLISLLLLLNVPYQLGTYYNEVNQRVSYLRTYEMVLALFVFIFRIGLIYLGVNWAVLIVIAEFGLGIFGLLIGQFAFKPDFAHIGKNKVVFIESMKLLFTSIGANYLRNFMPVFVVDNFKFGDSSATSTLLFFKRLFDIGENAIGNFWKGIMPRLQVMVLSAYDKALKILFVFACSLFIIFFGILMATYLLHKMWPDFLVKMGFDWSLFIILVLLALFNRLFGSIAGFINLKGKVYDHIFIAPVALLVGLYVAFSWNGDDISRPFLVQIYLTVISLTLIVTVNWKKLKSNNVYY